MHEMFYFVRKMKRISLFFVLLLALVAFNRSGTEVLPVSGQVDEELVREYLREHPKFLFEYLSENPAIVSDYLSSNLTIVYNFLSENPSVIHDYISANPTLVSNYLSNNSQVVTYQISGNPQIVSDYISEHQEFVTQFLTENPAMVSDYISGHPEVAKNLVYSYAARHRREVLGMTFNFILSQPMLLCALIGVVLIFPLMGLIPGWLMARRRGPRAT